MKYDIQATNIELTDAIRDYVDEKVQFLDKFLDATDTSVHAQVEVGKTTQHHHKGEVFRAEMNLHMSGHDVYATAENEDLYAAVDEMKDILSRELRNYKAKQTDKMRRDGSASKEALQEAFREEDKKESL